MTTSLYVALSGQIGREKRLETIATNVANMNSAGYRATGVSFEARPAPASSGGAVYVDSGADYISRRAGALTRTENPFDIAVKGEAWLGIKSANGIAYTRDGRLRLSESGALETINGDAVLDVGGAPLSLDPSGGVVAIASDGMISQNGKQLGAIGLFSLAPDAHLTRAANASVIPDQPAAAVLDFSQNGIAQGYIEASNVDPIVEMTKLISLSREFDDINSMISQTEGSLGDAIKTLLAGN